MKIKIIFSPPLVAEAKSVLYPISRSASTVGSVAAEVFSFYRSEAWFPDSYASRRCVIRTEDGYEVNHRHSSVVFEMPRGEAMVVRMDVGSGAPPQRWGAPRKVREETPQHKCGVKACSQCTAEKLRAEFSRKGWKKGVCKVCQQHPEGNGSDLASQPNLPPAASKTTDEAPIVSGVIDARGEAHSAPTPQPTAKSTVTYHRTGDRSVVVVPYGHSSIYPNPIADVPAASKAADPANSTRYVATAASMPRMGPGHDFEKSSPGLKRGDKVVIGRISDDGQWGLSVGEPGDQDMRVGKEWMWLKKLRKE